MVESRAYSTHETRQHAADSRNSTTSRQVAYGAKAIGGTQEMQATMGGERYTSMAPTAIGEADARRWMAFEQGRLRRIG